MFFPTHPHAILLPHPHHERTLSHRGSILLPYSSRPSPRHSTTFAPPLLYPTRRILLPAPTPATILTNCPLHSPVLRCLLPHPPRHCLHFEAYDAVSSPFFWAFLRVLEHLAVFLRRVTAWVESCDCHWHLLSDAALIAQLDSELVSAWRSCPMRTLRCGAMSHGELFALFHSISDLTAAELVMSLPTDISGMDRLGQL